MCATRKRVASHEEVYRVVKRQRIHLAEDLYQFAQDEDAKGNGRLLAYCSGRNGMKSNLQKTLSTMWLPPVDLFGAGHLGAAAPVCPSAAAASPGGRAGGESFRASASSASALPPLEVQTKTSRMKPRPTTTDMGGMRSITSGLTSDQWEPCAPTGPLLFDHFGLRAEAVFVPRGGLWRLRDFFEVLLACRDLAGSPLAGVAPSLARGGGLRLPRSETGWRSMLRSGVASPRVPFGELNQAQQAAAASEVRFGLACGALPWPRPGAGGGGEPPGPEDDDSWIDAMPRDPSFEVSILAGVPAEERLVRVWANKHVEDWQWLAVLRGFEACGHAMQQTVGFKIDRGTMHVTTSRSRAARHKHGATNVAYAAISAPTCAAELGHGTARRGPGPGPRRRILALVGGERSWKASPDAL